MALGPHDKMLIDDLTWLDFLALNACACLCLPSYLLSNQHFFHFRFNGVINYCLWQAKAQAGHCVSHKQVGGWPALLLRHRVKATHHRGWPGKNKWLNAVIWRVIAPRVLVDKSIFTILQHVHDQLTLVLIFVLLLFLSKRWNKSRK